MENVNGRLKIAIAIGLKLLWFDLLSKVGAEQQFKPAAIQPVDSVEALARAAHTRCDAAHQKFF